MSLEISVKEPRINPNLDNGGALDVDVSRKRPVPHKIHLPKFFDHLIDQKINRVAIMVIFHILHFFCYRFWSDYHQEYDRRLAVHKKKIEVKVQDHGANHET